MSGGRLSVLLGELAFNFIFNGSTRSLRKLHQDHVRFKRMLNEVIRDCNARHDRTIHEGKVGNCQIHTFRVTDCRFA